jgi:hypothetical protein
MILKFYQKLLMLGKQWRANEQYILYVNFDVCIGSCMLG